VECELIESELAAFHFGTVSSEARAAVEAHLVSCERCLRAFLAFKRAAEAEGGGPPDEARARLKRAVASRLAVRRRRRTIAAFAAAAAIAIAVGGALSLRALRHPPAPAVRDLDDSARLQPASLDVL